MRDGILAIISVALLAGMIGAHILPKHPARPRGATFEAAPPAPIDPWKVRPPPESLRADL